MKASEVVDHGRDEHAALTEINVPDQLLFRELSRGVRDLYDKIFPRVPAFLAQVLEVSMPLAVFADGVDLTAEIAGGWVDIPVGEFILSNLPLARGTVPARFAPWEQRLRPGRLPAFTLRNNVLFFLGTELDYARYSAFNLTFTPIPADIVNGDSVLPLPLDARECLALRLAAFGLGRLVAMPQFGVDAETAGAAAAKWREERTDFLTRVFRTSQNEEYHLNRVDQD